MILDLVTLPVAMVPWKTHTTTDTEIGTDFEEIFIVKPIER